MKKVLDHYEMMGAVEPVPISLPGFYPNGAAFQSLLFKFRYIYHTALESVVS